MWICQFLWTLWLEGSGLFLFLFFVFHKICIIVNTLGPLFMRKSAAFSWEKYFICFGNGLATNKIHCRIYVSPELNVLHLLGPKMAKVSDNMLHHFVWMNCSPKISYRSLIKTACAIWSHYRYWYELVGVIQLQRLFLYITLRPRQIGRHFSDDTFKRIFLNENVWILIKISLKFVPKGRINNIPSLVQIMAWRRPGDKPLSEPTMASLLTHIYVTRPQWDISVLLMRHDVVARILVNGSTSFIESCATFDKNSCDSVMSLRLVVMNCFKNIYR